MSTKSNAFAILYFFPVPEVHGILKIGNFITTIAYHLKRLLGRSRECDIRSLVFYIGISACNISRLPIFHGDTGNRYLVLTHGELIGVALAGCKFRDASKRFSCCFACSFCYIKRDEGCGALGIAWLDKGIELIIGVLIRFYTTDAEAVDAIDCSSGILVVEAINLYYYSRHLALHDERKLIAFGIALLAAIRHEVVGSK